VRALVEYCKAESRALLEQSIDIVEVLVEALIAMGTLNTDEISAIISACMTARSVTAEPPSGDPMRTKTQSKSSRFYWRRQTQFRHP
jgi:hypothetical protein